MSLVRFLPLSILSLLLWVGVYFVLGYTLGASMSELLEHNLMLLGPVLLLVFVVLVRLLQWLWQNRPDLFARKFKLQEDFFAEIERRVEAKSR